MTDRRKTCYSDLSDTIVTDFILDTWGILLLFYTFDLHSLFLIAMTYQVPQLIPTSGTEIFNTQHK
jgi:hypothetical protein